MIIRENKQIHCIDVRLESREALSIENSDSKELSSLKRNENIDNDFHKLDIDSYERTLKVV